MIEIHPILPHRIGLVEITYSYPAMAAMITLPRSSEIFPVNLKLKSIYCDQMGCRRPSLLSCLYTELFAVLVPEFLCFLRFVSISKSVRYSINMSREILWRKTEIFLAPLAWLTIPIMVSSLSRPVPAFSRQRLARLGVRICSSQCPIRLEQTQKTSNYSYTYMGDFFVT